ncbi:thioredoxin family protein [Chitinophaga sp. GCM10012297]|uniref:Thioredoxin family protein n=1 Tax=Chitinophaga chungangae TaxID=2821488 RepID=A0ABS3YG69_9BACT|nr:thioredoxin family protein [Chitinophaga chungangae]MBO9153445.1 thioredoxin family protein [Chitinophaga chungangae]
MRILKILLLSLISFSAAAADTAPGVQFFEGSWAELLQTAQKQGKLIFVDVYTDWCPPCKQMDKEIFPLKDVGDSYNAMFINYRLDAEKGEGVQLAGQFAVKAYPTYLYLDAKGSLLYRAVGFQTPEMLAANAKQAMASSVAGNNSISFFETQFKNGKRDADFLRAYLKRTAELGLDNTTALNAYLETLPVSRLSTEGELLYLSEQLSSARSNALEFVMTHYDKLNAEQKKKVAARLYSALLYTASGASMKEGRPVEVKQILAYITQLEPELTAKQLEGASRMRMMYYGMVKDVAGLKKTGYNLVGRSMDIPMDSVRAEDAKLYEQTMKPFLTGERDSTKIPGFQEEKQFIVNQYSRKLAMPLYESATAFAKTLDPGDPALADALRWALRLRELMPADNRFDELVSRLRTLSAQR